MTSPASSNSERRPVHGVADPHEPVSAHAEGPRIERIDDAPATEVAPGIVRRSLYSSGALTAWVIDFAPGSRWPEVDEHSGEERYLVLDGSVVEATGTACAGDYVSFDPGTAHRPYSVTGARIMGHNLP